MIEFYEKMSGLLAGNVPFVAVTIVDAQGSVPQEIGAKMLVVEDGLYSGTVGGGKVETRAVKEAQALLRGVIEGTPESKQGKPCNTMFANWSLNTDIGMTCGGSVKVYFEAFNTNPWSITVFGAGHCASALVELLVKLDCRVTCIDPREEWLKRLPDSPKLKKVMAEQMPGYVSEIHPGSFVVLMTMGHTTDKPILIEILKNWKMRQYPFLGVIGSQAKAARLKKDLVEAGLPEEYFELFYCPVGLSIGNNKPEEIAISIAAQLLQVRDRVALDSASKEGVEFGCMEPAACAEPS